MRVRPDNGIRIRELLTILVGIEDDAAQVLQVDLVHDAGVRRHDAEVIESRLPPTQERVAFLVTLKLDLVVEVERIGGAVVIDLYRMVDHQFRGRQRIDAARGTAKLDDGIAHRGKIDNGGHAGEVLQNDARGREGNFCARRRFRVPIRQCENIVARDITAVLVPKQVFQQDLEGIGKSSYMTFCNGVEAKNLELVITDRKRGASAKTVRHCLFSGVLGFTWRPGSRRGAHYNETTAASLRDFGR